MSIIKGIANLLSMIAFMIGFVLMCSESENILWNGGGIALMCISLLILSFVNKGEEKPESKGGDYYGIR